jgi:hypothetical protein
MHQGAVYDEPATDAASSDSYDSDEILPLEPNVDELLSLVSHQVGRQLLFIRRLTRGRYHEIHALFSPDRQ